MLILQVLGVSVVFCAGVNLIDFGIRKIQRRKLKSENTIEFDGIFEAKEYFKDRSNMQDHGRGKWFLFNRNVEYSTSIALAIGSIHGHYWKPEGIIERVWNKKERRFEDTETAPFDQLNDSLKPPPKYESTIFIKAPGVDPKAYRKAVHIHLGESRLSNKSIEQIQCYWKRHAEPAELLGILYADPLEQRLPELVGIHVENMGNINGQDEIIPFDFTHRNHEVSVSLSPEVDIPTAFSASASFRTHGRARDPHFLFIKEGATPWEIRVVRDRNV